MKPDFNLKLYFVTDKVLCGEMPLIDVITEAIAGGITMLQLREKNCSTKEFVDIALQIKPLLISAQIPLIINDRVDVALAVDADGVHIGQSDMPYLLVRKLLGPHKIIGLSVENYDQMLIANTLDIDYIGISPIFTTPTKTELTSGIGVTETTRIVAGSIHPSVAIGGINRNTITQTLSTGVNGVSVISAICASASPQRATIELKRIIEHHFNQ